MIDSITNLPRSIKGAILLLADHIIIILSWYIAICLRLNNIWPESYLQSSIPLLIWLLISGLIFARLFRLSHVKLSGFENHALLQTLYWIAVITIIGTCANILLELGAPRTVPVIFGSIAFLLILIERMAAKAFMEWITGNNNERIPIAIYGASSQGIQLLSALKNSKEYKPIVLLDNDKKLHNTIISGLSIYQPSKVEPYLKDGRVKKVIFATDKLSTELKSNFVNLLKSYDCEALELPSYVEMIKSGGLIKSLRPVKPEELLGRDGVDLEELDILNAYSEQNIFVSGAGGSIGSELSRQIINTKPKKVILFELSEYSLYTIEQELSPLASELEIELIPVLGSVCDEKHLEKLFKAHAINVVIHAAAYKHVPLVESNEIEGVQNNIIGTETLAKVASKLKISRFILISTDKAVRPTNIMGASKRLAEIIIQNHGENNRHTIFSIVRFGNVLGSSGSVIPLFNKQISMGGPVTVTDKEVIRYFMTISEASRLVLLAGAYANGGEVFVLDMGKPVKIYDMAKQMIELSGLTVKDEQNPNGDIEIEVTGLRPGEKLYEELLIDDDTLETPHPKILRAKEKKLSNKQLQEAIAAIKKSIHSRNKSSARSAIKRWVSEYTG